MELKMRSVLIVSYALSLLSHSHALQNDLERVGTEGAERIQTISEKKTDETAKANRLSTRLSVYVKEYRFYGNTVFSDLS